MDRIFKRVNKTRTNWLEAFKVSCNIHGYNYYEMPGEIRYRYPAPGSCDLDKTSHPHLFKRHWKLPFRDSPFNIRPMPNIVAQADDHDHYISEMPRLDSKEDAEFLKQPKVDTSDLSLMHPELGNLDNQETMDFLRESFAGL